MPSSAADSPICSLNTRPVLIIATNMGPIEIELAEAAAPDAVRRLAELVRGPIFNSELTADNPYPEPFSYYDGLEFISVLRGTKVVSDIRPPRHAILIPNQINAEALGLDRQIIDDPAKAMDLWQHTLIRHYMNAKTEQDIHPRLVTWAKENARTGRVDFLLEASRKQINEALGYRYVDDLPSLPVTRGAVSLEQFNPRWSTPALHISLRDRPDLTGKRMVVGRVVAGLELVDAFSTHRLTPEKTLHSRPLVPVLISSSTVECRDIAVPSSSLSVEGQGVK